MDFLTADFWTNLFYSVGINVLQLIAAIIIYFIVKAVGGRIIARSFNRYREKKNISTGRAFTLEKLAVSAYSYVLFFIFLVIGFGIFDLPIASLIAGAGVIGLAIGFGAQGLVSDVVTGFFLLLEKQIDVGDYVTVASFGGIVEEVGLRTTQVRGFDGTLHYVPNRIIDSVSNHSRGNMQSLVDIGIAYEENVDKAIAVIQEACDKVGETNENIVDGPNVLGVQALGTSDVTIRVLAQSVNMEQWGVERELKKAIKDALDGHGIEIPYPHQVNVTKEISNA